jgi:hypothetical protein
MTRRMMRSTLACIHMFMVILNDATSTTVFLVDLERLRQGTPDEVAAELADWYLNFLNSCYFSRGS